MQVDGDDADKFLFFYSILARWSRETSTPFILPRGPCKKKNKKTENSKKPHLINKGIKIKPHLLLPAVSSVEPPIAHGNIFPKEEIIGFSKSAFDPFFR
jgi:hypothetical protein